MPRFPIVSGKMVFWIIAVLLVINMATIRLHAIHELYETDTVGTAYIAHQLLEGKKLYVDVWDHKPPGMAFCFVIFQLLFGYDDVSLYVLNLFFSALVLILIGLLARDLMGTVPAIVAMFLYALVAQNPNIQSEQPNTEVMINAFKLAGIFLLLLSFRFSGRSNSVLSFLSGLSVGISSAFKTITVVSFLGMIFVVFLCRDGKSLRELIKRTILFAGGAASIWVAIVLYTMSVGSFGAFWDAVFRFNYYYVESGLFHKLIRIPQAVFSSYFVWEYSLIIVSLIFLGTLAFPEKRREKIILVIMFAASSFEVVLPGWGWKHYYQLLVPFIVLTSTWAVSECLVRLAVWKSFACVAVFFVLIVIPLVRKNLDFLNEPVDKISLQCTNPQIFPDAKRLGIYMKERFLPNLKIFEWGDEASLYYYSGLDTNMPFFYRNPFTQGSVEESQNYLTRLYDSFAADPPDVFIDTPRRSRFTPLDDYVKNNYKLYTDFGPYFTLYCNNKYLIRGNDGEKCNIEK